MLHKQVRTSFFVIVIVVAIVSQLHFPASARAVSENSSTRSAKVRQLEQDPVNSNRENLAENRTEKTEERCAEAQIKTTEQIKKFDGRKSELDARYAKYIKKLELIITKLTAEGVTTTDLQQDKETLVGLTAELTTALSLYADKVEAAQQLAPNCGTAQGEFKLALQAARTQMQVVRTKVQAIRSFMTGTLKDDLFAARQELLAMKKATSLKPSATPRPKTSPTPKPTSTPAPIQ